MIGYLSRLRHHPGVPIAAALTLLGAAAGAPRNWLLGALIMSVYCWPIVFWTARR